MARPPEGYWVDGCRIISLTEALNESRVRRLQGSPAVLERRQRIGTAVHRATAVLDCNSTTWQDAPREWIEEFDAVDPEVEPFILSWEGCKRDYDFVPRLVEHTIITKTGIAQFGTTLDREGLLRGEPAIIELKTPKVKEPWWGVQLAGQELAVICSQGPPHERPYKYQRFAAQLFSSGKPGKLIPYTDPHDKDAFLWSLGLAIWNRENYRSEG